MVALTQRQSRRATPYLIQRPDKNYCPLQYPPAENLPQFVDVPQVSKRISEDSLYADVINHSRNPVLNESRATNAHETVHMINADLRNAKPGQRVNAFYVGRGKGLYVNEPHLKKSDVIEFLPQSLRSYRYSLYIAGARQWEDTPTYLCDEAIAYWVDGQVGVEDIQTGRHKGGNTDGVSGCLDFSIYTIALAMAIEKHDSQYWKSDTQFRQFLTWYLKGACKTFQIGSQMKQFQNDGQDKLLEAFLRGQEGEKMRQFVHQHLGNAWLEDYLKYY